MQLNDLVSFGASPIRWLQSSFKIKSPGRRSWKVSKQEFESKNEEISSSCKQLIVSLKQLLVQLVHGNSFMVSPDLTESSSALQGCAGFDLSDKLYRVWAKRPG